MSGKWNFAHHDHVMVIDRISAGVDRRQIEMLFGLLKKQWSIRLIPDDVKLDTAYNPTEIVEF